MVLPSRRLVESLQGRTVQGFFVDVADIIYRTAGTPDAYGQPTYTENEVEVQCSFTDKPSKETWAGYADIENIEAEIRFVNDKPNKGDRVRLKIRFSRVYYASQKYADQQFEIVAIRDRDVFGYVCALKAVQI